jgi:hypothetical protein
MVGIKDSYQQIVGSKDNLLPFDLSPDEAPTTNKQTNAFCLRKVSYNRSYR